MTEESLTTLPSAQGSEAVAMAEMQVAATLASALLIRSGNKLGNMPVMFTVGPDDAVRQYRRILDLLRAPVDHDESPEGVEP